MNHAITASMLVPAALLGGCHVQHWNHNPSYHAAHMIELEAPSGASDMNLRTEFGDLDIAAVGTPISAWALKHYTGEVPQGAFVLAIAQSQDEDRPWSVEIVPNWTGNGLTVADHWPGGRNGRRGEGVSYTVRLPVIGSVEAFSEFGDLDVLHANGAVRAFTEFGDIVVEDGNTPEAHLETQHGDIEVAGVFGPVFASSDFGDIDAVGLGGPVEADTDFGDIELRLLSSNVGPFSAITEFGDVRVFAGPAMGGSIEIETDFGQTVLRGMTDTGKPIRIRSEEKSTFTISEGEVSVARTEHGDVRVEISNSE